MLIFITVFRDREHDLVRCFKSIELIDKTLRHFVRHIIVDGGSTDQSSSIVKSYKNAGLIEVNSYTVLDESIYEGFNNGIKIAEELYSENDYVSFLHSDDTIGPGINDAIRFLINERLDYLETITEYEVDGKVHIRNIRGRFSFFRAPFNHMSLIYRLGVHESLGYYPLDLGSMGDLEFMLKLIRCHGTALRVTTRVFSIDGVSSRKKSITQYLRNIYRSYSRSYNRLIGGVAVLVRFLVRVLNA